MAYKKRKQLKRRPIKRRLYAKKRRAVRASKPLAKAIRSVVTRMAEKKSQTAYDLDQNLVVSSNGSFVAQNIHPMGPDSTTLPVIPGTGRSNRTGDKITTKRLYIKGNLVMLPYNASTNVQPAPTHVKIWFLYDKMAPVTKPDPRTDFFQYGNTNQAFLNDLVDHQFPINTEKYAVLASKVMKLGYASSTGTGVIPGYQSFANNDYKLNCSFSFDLTKHYPKTVVFDATSNTPSTRGLWMMFQPVAGCGYQYASTEIVCQASWIQSYEFTDF